MFHCLLTCTVFNEKSDIHPYLCSSVLNMSGSCPFFPWLLFGFAILSLVLSNLIMVCHSVVFFMLPVPRDYRAFICGL